jgi:hypothetical protein
MYPSPELKAVQSGLLTALLWCVQWAWGRGAENMELRQSGQVPTSGPFWQLSLLHPIISATPVSISS